MKLIIYSPLVKGGADPGSRRLSFRIIVRVWLLIAMVLVKSYASTVISHLTVPKMKPRINTLEDLPVLIRILILLYGKKPFSESSFWYGLTAHYQICDYWKH